MGREADDPIQSGEDYLLKIDRTIAKMIENQPAIFDSEVQECWQELISGIRDRLSMGFDDRSVDLTSCFPEILANRLKSLRRPSIGYTEGFKRDHRLDMIDGMECITYTGAQKGEIKRRRMRLEDVVDKTEMKFLIVGGFVLYVWTLSYQPDSKFPGLGK
jgi:hypothetical protein